MSESERALEKLIRNAAGFADGLTSVEFARLQGVSIVVVSRWRNRKEPKPPGWSFVNGRWIPIPDSTEEEE